MIPIWKKPMPMLNAAQVSIMLTVAHMAAVE